MAVDQPSPIVAPSGNGSAGNFAAVRRGFVAYAHWLDSISWKRFFLLSLLALIVSGILSELPPFNLKWGQDKTVIVPPGAAKRKEAPVILDGVKRHGRSYDINIDENGVRITPSRPAAAASAASAPQADSAAPAGSAPGPGISITPEHGVTIRLPSNADTEEIKRAIEEAQSEIEDAIADTKPKVRTIHAFRLGDHLPGVAMLLIVMSMITKIMAAGRFKAEAQALQAMKDAESEALKCQVMEARMAAMQAQVEPHFLFNTLASIDHLIETDPPRASKMQKNLIALLRAAMPTMREANAQARHDLGRELAVIRPYLEILKVRMEERLHTEVRVSDGLLSAEFPPMMLQSLVENAIKHGLEPKADGGTLTVSAEIVHGKLVVTVSDSGLGFGRAATAGTGIGLNNIRERLKLLYGSKAGLTVAENPGGGTAVTITVPYSTRNDEGNAA
ncbi:sensor histidine kinase [Piscinibacter sp.]|jgi:hypothetical protein|uniref:sensor histidine kinase n=1 Tax=Piscinibacter sp. TaxID=1903157 RepID=UPI0035597C5C